MLVEALVVRLCKPIDEAKATAKDALVLVPSGLALLI
jgi:hypothetical protein